MPFTVTTTELEGFRQHLAEAVVLTVDQVMAPLEEVHTVVKLNADAKTFSLPNGSGIDFSAATDGQSGVNPVNADNIITETNLTPTPFYASVPIARRNLLDNPFWFDHLRTELAKGAHKSVMGSLVSLYDDFSSAAATGVALTAALVNTADITILGNGFGGTRSMVIHPTSYGSLRTDLGTNFTETDVTNGVLDTGRLSTVYGNRVYVDSNVTEAANGYRNFIGTKDAIYIVWRQMVDIVFIDLDAINVAVSASIWYQTGHSSSNRTKAQWLRNF